MTQDKINAMQADIDYLTFELSMVMDELEDAKQEIKRLKSAHPESWWAAHWASGEAL